MGGRVGRCVLLGQHVPRSVVGPVQGVKHARAARDGPVEDVTALRSETKRVRLVESEPAIVAVATVVDPLQALIRSRRGMAEQLIFAHQADENGRCRECSSGAQVDRYMWPCAIYKAALAADEGDRVSDQLK